MKFKILSPKLKPVNKLKVLRLGKGLSQDEMALRLKMTPQNYRNYEAGRYVAMAPELEEKISEILGVKYTYDR